MKHPPTRPPARRQPTSPLSHILGASARMRRMGASAFTWGGEGRGAGEGRKRKCTCVSWVATCGSATQGRGQLGRAVGVVDGWAGRLEAHASAR